MVCGMPSNASSRCFSRFRLMSMAINRSKHDTTELLSMVSTLDVEEKA
jgi:hypothetical protein